MATATKKGAAAKKTSAKKTAAKKGTGWKAAAKKGTTKKAAAKKGTARKSPAKKAATKKTAANKTAGKKGSPKKNKLGVKNSLVNNINAHKKRGDSKSSKGSTVSKKAYQKMERNWDKKD